MVPGHYLDQCWLIINEIWCHSFKGDIYVNTQDINSQVRIENHTFEITATYPRRQWVNTLRPRQNGRHSADDIFKCILLNENIWITIKNSLKFVPKVPINNIPAVVQIMAWRRPGDKALSETMLVSLPTHICNTRPQWVNLPCVTEAGGLSSVSI